MANFARFVTFLMFSHRSGSESPISHDLQLFQSFPTEVAQNDSERPISPNLQLSNLFPLKWLRMTRNGQFCLICNSPNLFPPE